MFQDTKDKFQSISSFVKDTEKYVKDEKLNINHMITSQRQNEVHLCKCLHTKHDLCYNPTKTAYTQKAELENDDSDIKYNLTDL